MGLFDWFKAKEMRPPTRSQLSRAERLGVKASNRMSYEQLSKLIEKAEYNLPPDDADLALCKKVGLSVSPNMKRGQVRELIEKAKDKRAYKSKFEAIERADQQEIDNEERDKYGDAVFSELRKWEKITDEGKSCLLIFRRGKNVVVDVVEVEFAEVVEGKNPCVKIGVLLPKRVKEKGSDDCIEWEKSAEIKTSNILHVQQIDPKMFVEDAAVYDRVVAKGVEFAKRFES